MVVPNRDEVEMGEGGYWMAESHCTAMQQSMPTILVYYDGGLGGTQMVH